MRDHLERHHPDKYHHTKHDNDSGRGTQTTLLVKHKCSERRTKEINFKLLDFIVLDLRPIAIVDGCGFRRFVECLEPGYNLPSRKYLTKLLHQKFEEAKQVLKEKLLDDARKMSLTTDIWTSAANDAYLSLTAHPKNGKWVPVFWQQKSFLDITHAGVNIADTNRSIVTSFEIESSKVLAVDHDQGSNVRLSGELLENDLEWESAAHKLHSGWSKQPNYFTHTKCCKEIGQPL